MVGRKLAVAVVAGAVVLGNAEKVSNGLGDFLTVITSREFRSLGGEHSYLSRIIKADEGAPQLTECLLDGGLIEPSLLRFFSGHFAQAAITSAGVQEDDPVSLLRKLLPTGAATLDYTRDRSILAPLRTTTTATVGANGRSSGSQDPSPKFCTPPYAELADKPQDVDPLLDWQRTMTETSDGFNILHSALGHEKTALRHRTVQDLLYEDPAKCATVQRTYRRLGKALAFAVHDSEPKLAAKLLRATRRLADAPPMDYKYLPALNGSVPGKVFRLEDKAVLDSVLSGLLADELLAHARAMHGRLTRETLTTVGPTLAQVPHIANLIGGQDRFGRTPLHMCAVTDNAFGVRVLRRHLVASLGSSNISDIAWRNVTAAAVFLPDINGMTPRQLATLAGNDEAATALRGLEEEMARLHPLGPNMPRTAHRSPAPPRTVPAMPLPSYTPQPGVCPNNGGWTEPRFVSKKARAAVDSFRDFAPSECDIDVIDYTNCSLKDERAHKCGITPAAFFQHYFLPSKPVLLRGYARRYEAFRKWNPAYFLTRFGDIDVRVSEIPYATQWGVKGETMPMKEHIQAMLMCDPSAATTGLKASPAAAMAAARGAGGDMCGMPEPLVDIPPELCAAFTRDDSSFVRLVDGENPLPSSRLYVFHSITREAALADPKLLTLYNDITPLPMILNGSIPLWSTKGRARPTAHTISAFNVDSRGRSGAAAAPPLRHVAPEVLQEAMASKEAGSESGATPGSCEQELVHWGNEVIQLFVGGPGSGAPMHYHQDAFNTLLYGQKHWYLQPPSPKGPRGQGSEFGIVAIADYVNKVIPTLPPEERPLQCTQRAGDIAYVPYAYGHGCFNTETSIGWATEIDTDYGRYSRL